MKTHLWSGEWLDDAELADRIERLPEWLARSLQLELSSEVVIEAAERYAGRLKDEEGRRLARIVAKEAGLPMDDAASLLGEMAAFLEKKNLRKKLKAELGSFHPFLPARTTYEGAVFEAWAPLGFLVHVAPSNAPSVGPLSVVEGLLSGNVNFLKTSGSDGSFAPEFLKGLIDADSSGMLAHFIASARIPSRETALLSRVFAQADAISAWGGEDAIASVRKLAPPAARVVEWGHKISFAYLTVEDTRSSDIIRNLARECCLFEQQACSSPQCVYLETEDWTELARLGEALARSLEKVSPAVKPASPPPRDARAEITLVTELSRQEACFGQAKVMQGKDWRILVDARSALAASPLYRTVWVKPLSRGKIIETLRPMRAYLQTVGLSSRLSDFADLSSRFTRAGAVRVRRIGEMTESYGGEPHDGVYALQRYCKRVSLQAGDDSAGYASFRDLRATPSPRWEKRPSILTKEKFQGARVDDSHAHLYFKSGGSSGEPKLSVYTYDDYHEQMAAGAEGLVAAGLDPLKDRCMNLFFSGALYGGFLSVFTMLEDLHAVQFPMGAQMDFPLVADAVIRNRVNVLMGMPSYIVQLFEKCADPLKAYARVEKVIYGGEHFNDAQRKFLRESFGVRSIKSVGYGSVDAGPLGYQCRHCEGGVHHLQQGLQFLEILKLAEDRPAAPGEVGRFVFTSRVREGQKIERYEIGDIGHWVQGPCACGRAAPLFKLLGRMGDVFRIGSIFLNYQKFEQILSEKLGYASAVQLLLSSQGLKERLALRLSLESGISAETACAVLLEGYADLQEVVVREKLLEFTVDLCPSERMDRAKGSGKLRRIIDSRESSHA